MGGEKRIYFLFPRKYVLLEKIAAAGEREKSKCV